MVEQSERLEPKGYAIIVQISTGRPEHLLGFQYLTKEYAIEQNEGIIFTTSFSMKLSIYEMEQEIANLLRQDIEIELVIYIIQRNKELIIISGSGVNEAIIDQPGYHKLKVSSLITDKTYLFIFGRTRQEAEQLYCILKFQTYAYSRRN